MKILPLGAVGRTYGDRMLAIGDAAGLVKPTTGGGIHYSIVSGALAAGVVISALADDRAGRAEPVGLRARVADGTRGRVRSAAGAARGRRVPERRSDRQLLELAHTDGIMPIVRATARFNEHRPLIRAPLFKHPPRAGSCSAR